LTCISRLRTRHIFKTKTITKVKKIQTATPYDKCFGASEYALQIGTLVQRVQVNILGGFSKKKIEFGTLPKSSTNRNTVKIFPYMNA
jgi:hypothetical protein